MKARYFGVLLFICAVALMSLPFNIPGNIPYFDKFAHLSVFLALTLGISRIFPVWKTLTILFILAILLETLQFYIPNRTFSLLDMASNMMGIITGYILILFLKKVNQYERIFQFLT